MFRFDIDRSFYIGLIIVPIAWLLLYYLQGTYLEIRRMYRLKAISLSLSATIIGSIFIFFILLLDDNVNAYTKYYQSLGILFFLHFFSTLIFRLFLTTILLREIKKINNGFKTLLVGGSQKALTLHEEISSNPDSVYNFVGFISLNGVDQHLSEKLPHLGKLDKIQWVIREKKIEEIIIALESSEHNKLKNIISKISGVNIKIKILPDMFDILSGSVRMTSIFGALLLEINQGNMPIWQQASKRFIDIFCFLFCTYFVHPSFL